MITLLSLAAAVLIVGSTSHARAGNDEFRAIRVSETEDASSVEVFLQNVHGQGVHLKIPQAYFGRYHQRGGIEHSLHMYADFTEMQPVRRAQRRPAEILDDVLQKLENPNVPTADEPTETEELDYQGRVELGAIVPEAATSAFDRFTMKHPEDMDEPADPYFRRFQHTDNAGRIAFEYLVPRDEFGSKSTWIYCLGPPPERPGRTKCTVEVPFGDRLRLKYSIPRRHLAEWRAVDARVKAWVRTLIVACFDAPLLEPGGQPTAFHSCEF